MPNGDSPITPRPNYESMVTPAMKKELKKYGIRGMSRRKAIPLLDHIYKETHPACNRQKQVLENQDLNLSPGSSASSNKDDCESEELMEESILLTAEQMANPEFSEELLSQAPKSPTRNVNLRELVLKFIQKDVDMYRKCLTYEPIWLEEFFTDFKTYAISENVAKKEIKLNLVTDILDNECITFRTEARAARNKAVNAKGSRSKHKENPAAGDNVKGTKGKKRISRTQSEKVLKSKKQDKKCASQF